MSTQPNFQPSGANTSASIEWAQPERQAAFHQWLNAQASAHGVLPATVRAGDREYLEGVDIDADDFYDLVAAGHSVTTVEPSAGQFAVAYDELVAQGCTEIMSPWGDAVAERAST